MCGAVLTCFLDRPRGAHRSFDRPRVTCLCAVICLTSTGPAYVRYPALPLMRGTRLYLRHPRLCAVPGVLCLRAVLCLPRQGPGCFDSPRLPLMCFAVLCFASTPPALPSTPPGVLTCLCPALPHFDSPRLCALLCLALLRHPPGVLCLLCLRALPGLTWPYFLRALLAYVFPTHTEGGDPGSLHEKKIKTKEF